MPKSPSPAKTRGRPKTKAAAAGEERPKSRGRQQSRGRSATPKEAKARASSAKRSASKSRSRARSQTRKSEPKEPRARSSSRRRSVPRKVAEEKEAPPAPTRVSRRTIARDALKTGKNIVDSPDEGSKVSSGGSVVKEFFDNLLQSVKNFGYRRTFSASFWLISLPLFTFVLHLLCSRDKCYIRFDPTIPKTLKVYFDLAILTYGGCFVLLQVALSAIPIGKVVQGFGYRRASYQYRSNSFFCLLTTLAIYAGAVYYFNHPNTQVLHTHRFKCVSGASIIAFVVSFLLYLKSFNTNPFHLNHGSQCSPGITLNHVHDFVHGREISPKVGSTFDLGLTILRTANSLWAIAIISAVLQARAIGGGPVFGLSYNVATVAALQFIYVIFGSFNEINLLKSAFINQGVGFLYVYTAGVLVPFCATLPLRYLVENRAADHCVYCYIPCALLFLTGLVLIHYSNTLKYNNARVGGKTIRSGPWKFVRHPNYLGELLCILAWTLPCGKVYLAYGQFVFSALLVLCRSRQVEKNTNADYRSYQKEVKSRVLPFIY